LLLLQRFVSLDRTNKFSLSTNAFDAAMHILLLVAQVVSSISHFFDSSTPAPLLVLTWHGQTKSNGLNCQQDALVMCLNTIIHFHLLLLATITSSCKIVAVPEQPIHA
jgi:hypothetical protein